jgi:protein-S-isoprenylcysteine O-methyltransferase Ste14
LDVLRVILAWTAFAVFHSLTVSESYEDLVRRWTGDRAFDRYHRLVFTAYSVAVFLLLVFFLRSLPDRSLYRLGGMGRILFHVVQLCGVAFLFWTPWDLKEFVGLRQWERHREGRAAEPSRNDRLFTGKAYGVVRHPLYFGISVVLAFHPIQTRNSLVSTLMVILYFYVGTFFEERRMVHRFGEEYRHYQRRVPRFLPLRFRHANRFAKE